MVTVYFKNGQTAQLNGAESAEAAAIWDVRGGGALWGIVCKDASGEFIGEFKMDGVSGYAIGPAPTARSMRTT